MSRPMGERVATQSPISWLGEGAGRRGAYTARKNVAMGALVALVSAEPDHAFNALWRAVPGFRYDEDDDWGLAAADLRDASIEVLVKNGQARHDLRTYVVQRIRETDFDDADDVRQIAGLVEALASAEAIARDVSPEAASRMAKTSSGGDTARPSEQSDKRLRFALRRSSSRT